MVSGVHIGGNSANPLDHPGERTSPRPGSRARLEDVLSLP